jgi:transposase
VRKIENAIDFNFIYDLVQDEYSETGRPSIAVVLIKIVLIQHLFACSMRQTIRKIETNVAYRWLIGYDFTNPFPDFSTFGKNYIHRFRNTNLFESMFQWILKEAVRHGFVDSHVLFIHGKASANKHPCHVPKDNSILPLL